MLARDWFYSQRSRIGLDTAVASIYDLKDDSDLQARGALKPGANFYLRDIVFVSMPDGSERDVEQWADFQIKNHDFSRESVVTHMRDEYSTFGWVMERMLTEVGFTLVSADYHAPLHGTYLLRKPKPGEQG